MDDALLDQYSRQILLDDVGYDGQELLLRTTVEVEGLEPFRGWAQRYLAAAGLQVSVAPEPGESFPNGVRVLVAGRLIREIPLPGNWGEALNRLGLDLAVFLLDLLGELEGV